MPSSLSDLTPLSHRAPTSPHYSTALTSVAVVPQPVLLSALNTQVRLPTLSLKRFGGDLTKWVSFWDSFSSAVHSNPSLSAIDKFNYLVSLLESTAADRGGLGLSNHLGKL